MIDPSVNNSGSLPLNSRMKLTFFAPSKIHEIQISGII